jgi:hypothetical protein
MAFDEAAPDEVKYPNRYMMGQRPLSESVAREARLRQVRQQIEKAEKAEESAKTVSVPWTTKDSGAREFYDSGMVRDTEKGKPRFDLLWPEGVPYSAQYLTRCAELMARGAEKYGDRNWEKGTGDVELRRAVSSALRHLHQWVAGETDEDHAAAVFFNIMQVETLRYKAQVNQQEGGQ